MEKSEIQRLIDDGITLEQVSNELEYRDNASSECRWDDNLCEYTTEELEEVETELIKLV